jgi:hypothetical protein
VAVAVVAAIQAQLRLVALVEVGAVAHLIVVHL